MEECLSGIGLNLGAGKVRWPSPWVNVDLDHGDLQADLKALPLPDDYAEKAVAIHVIEHFYQWEVQDVLKEWKRVLQPGGKLVLELPCMDKVLNYIAVCVQQGAPLSPTMTWHVFWGDPKYQEVLMVHKWGYTQAMIADELTKAGFVDIVFADPRYHFAFRDMRVEATKP